MKYVLAVDGGNSKTLAAVADDAGGLYSLSRETGCNFQGIGRKRSGEVLSNAIGQALREAGRAKVDSACYGLAGADRDKDFEIFREILKPIDPATKSILVNDTLLALRAGTVDGVGVALIGGAGSNCIGMNREGKIKKAWGLGPLTGDQGNASTVVHQAIVEAMKGVDGRGPRTILEDKFKKALGIAELEDIIEFEYMDSPREFKLGSLAPLVFEAANEGDQSALKVLREQGAAVGEAALAVMRNLFSGPDEVPLVMGGSVLQKGSNPALVDAIRDKVVREFPRARMVVLEDHPLLGGLLRALDALGERPSLETVNKLKSNLYARLKQIS